MLYLVTTLTAALGLAVAAITTETSTKYFARYVIENETSDLGAIVDEAKAEGQAPAPSPDAEAAASVGSMTPILARTLVETPAPVPAPEASETLAPEAAEALPTAETEAEAGNPVTDPAPELAALPDDPPAEAILSLIRDTPHRLPGGTVFLPVATQRLFSMRWQVARERSVARTYEIPGRITTDPATKTGVYAPRVGVLESIDGRFPYLGMPVRKGDLLAYLRPVVDIGQRAQIEAQMADLTNQASLAYKQIARLKQVLFVRYRENKIEALKIQIEGYQRQLASLKDALDGREELRAEADGVVSGIYATSGAVVAQNGGIFDIVDPDALWVDAAAYNQEVADNITGAAAETSHGRPLELEFSGGGLTLNNQAIPLRFRIVGGAKGLSVGNPVTVVVESGDRVNGVTVPASSVVRNADGQNLVWERVSAEVFRPHYVEAVKLAGDEVVLSSEVPNGLRIVTEGASILSQVR